MTHNSIQALHPKHDSKFKVIHDVYFNIKIHILRQKTPQYNTFNRCEPKIR
jgi:hypothetical protein